MCSTAIFPSKKVQTISTAPVLPGAAYTNGYEFASGSGYEFPAYAFRTPPELIAASQEPGIDAQQPVLYPIVIVGAGLVGLTLACSLARLGVQAVLLDEDNTVGVKGAASRGICYTQQSLEIFQRLGIYDRIAAKGVQWEVGRTFAGADEVHAFDLSKQGGFGLSQQPPFINIQQFYVEGFLVERIARSDRIDLRWLSRVTQFEQRSDHAVLAVQTPTGNYTLKASHVVDATGSASPFHAWCGVGMDVQKGDDRWCIADVRFKHQPPTERHTWIEAPFNDNRAVWQHLMADGVWRIDYQMPAGADPRESGSLANVTDRLRRQFGPDTEFEVVWVGPYAYRSQCLHQLRSGSVFFMGDAAKIVSPFGARGGNTGIADADNLAWKLAAWVTGRAPSALLASYHEERHEAARHNVLVTNRTTRFLRPRSSAESVFRQAAISLARQHPFARHLVNTGRMATANRYNASSVCAPGAGVHVQNAAWRWPDGSLGHLNQLLDWADGNLLLLVFGPLKLADLKALAQLTASRPVRCVQVLRPGSPRSTVREHVTDDTGHVRAACHVQDDSLANGTGHPARLVWALLRPDSYLAAMGHSVGAQLWQAIARTLAIP